MQEMDLSKDDYVIIKKTPKTGDLQDSVSELEMWMQVCLCSILLSQIENNVNICKEPQTHLTQTVCFSLTS